MKNSNEKLPKNFLKSINKPIPLNDWFTAFQIMKGIAGGSMQSENPENVQFIIDESGDEFAFIDNITNRIMLSISNYMDHLPQETVMSILYKLTQVIWELNTHNYTAFSRASKTVENVGYEKSLLASFASSKIYKNGRFKRAEVVRLAIKMNDALKAC